MTLVILAAGLGSRFGGNKQTTPVGPNGEFIIDYSCHDAVAAGFDHIVFVIKEENYEIFRETIGKRVEPYVKVDYAFQDVDDLPEGFTRPEGRTKPWGTAHALLAARPFVKDAFATINADDFYGKSTYGIVADFLKKIENPDKELKFCMAGFILNNTLSENGSVSRGICKCSDDGLLESITERTKIIPEGNDAYFIENDEKSFIPGDSIASMNFFGLTPAVFEVAAKGFREFLPTMTNPMKNEYYLPTVVTEACEKYNATVMVCQTPEKWYGVTYADDKDSVIKSIREMIDAGVYREKLWEDL